MQRIVNMNDYIKRSFTSFPPIVGEISKDKMFASALSFFVGGITALSIGLIFKIYKRLRNGKEPTRAQVASLERALVESSINTANIQVQLDEAKKGRAAIQVQFNTLNKKVNKKKLEIEQTLSELEAKLTTVKREKCSAEETNGKLRATYERMQNQLNHQIGELRKGKLETEKTLTEVSTTTKDLQAQLMKLMLRNKELEDEKSSMGKEIAKIKAKDQSTTVKIKSKSGASSTSQEKLVLLVAATDKTPVQNRLQSSPIESETQPNVQALDSDDFYLRSELRNPHEMHSLATTDPNRYKSFIYDLLSRKNYFQRLINKNHQDINILKQKINEKSKEVNKNDINLYKIEELREDGIDSRETDPEGFNYKEVNFEQMQHEIVQLKSRNDQKKVELQKLVVLLAEHLPNENTPS